MKLLLFLIFVPPNNYYLLNMESTVYCYYAAKSTKIAITTSVTSRLKVVLMALGLVMWVSIECGLYSVLG